MTLLDVLDYIYYRIAKEYFNWDGKSATTAHVLISLLEMVFLIDVFSVFWVVLVPLEKSKEMAMELKVGFVALAVVILFANHYRYKNNYSKFHSRWKNENRTASIVRGWIIVFSYILLLSFVPVLLEVI